MRIEIRLDEITSGRLTTICSRTGNAPSELIARLVTNYVQKIGMEDADTVKRAADVFYPRKK